MTDMSRNLEDGFRISTDHIVISIIRLLKVSQIMWSVASSIAHSEAMTFDKTLIVKVFP